MDITTTKPLKTWPILVKWNLDVNKVKLHILWCAIIISSCTLSNNGAATGYVDRNLVLCCATQVHLKLHLNNAQVSNLASRQWVSHELANVHFSVLPDISKKKNWLRVQQCAFDIIFGLDPFLATAFGWSDVTVLVQAKMISEQCLTIQRVKEYPTMHYFGIPRDIQSMTAQMILTEHFWIFEWKTALWECC